MKRITTKEKNQMLENLKRLAKVKDLIYNDYYRVVTTPRNRWRADLAFKAATEKISNNKEFMLKGAQWGGKWGNYYRLIALNSKGEYQYVEGFNPKKLLS